MFSGIVEAQTKILKVVPLKESCRIVVQRPKYFSDIKIGDSIATNGVCLSIEAFDAKSIQFCLGAETLKILGHQFSTWKKYPLNFERSLQLGQRVHGHLVTGHVDANVLISKSYQHGECWQIQIEIPKTLKAFFWKKGSVCLNGVSLTVNEIVKKKSKTFLEVCLIPETMKSTNLVKYKKGESLNIEADYLAKAYIQSQVKD